MSLNLLVSPRQRSVLALSVAAALFLAAHPGAQAPPAPAKSAPFSVPVDYFTLPNGLKVVVSEDKSAPVVFVEVMYNIGFRIEPKGRTGFAHLFEHMMFQGSGQVKKMEHASLVQHAGGVVNGSTRLDYTNYFQVMPSNALELAMWLEADRMRSLDVSAENLKNQQNVVSEEVRVNVLNQPHGAFEWLDIWQRANTNWANAHNFYGDLAELEAATLEDVRAFFKTYYAPNNAVLVVVGDTSAAEVKKLAEKHFGSVPKQPVPAPADVSEPPQKEEKRFTREDKLARTPALAIGWHLPQRMTKDFFALSVLDPLITGDDSARLYQKLVRDDRLAMQVIGAFNFLGSNWDVKGPMLYTVRVDYLNDKTAAQVLGAVESVLADIRSKGISEAELAQAKTALKSGFFEDMEGGMMPRFGRANLLAAFALFDNDPSRVNTILAELDKVTVDDVKAAANRWFVPANQTSIDSRPVAKPTSGEERRSGARREWRAPRAGPGRCAMMRVTVIAAVLAALLAAGVPAASAQTSARPAVGPERQFTPPPRVEKTLPNGLRVVAVRYVTVPKVSVVLTVQSGLAVDPAEKAGLAQFVADVTQEGTTSRDSRRIKQDVFAMGATLTAAAGQDTSSFTVRGLADTLPAMLGVLADVVRNPTFPQDEIDLLKANTSQALKAQLASPQFVGNRVYRQTLFGSHPYSRIGATPETVGNIDRASIVEYHKTYYRPNNTFIVVTGDVTADAAFAAVEKAFGDWARGNVPPPPSQPTPPLDGRRIVFVQRPNSVQSSISVGNFTIRRNDPRWPVLNVANQIYGGAFDSRLVRNIREEKGYTYSPQSVFQAMGQAGLYRAVADVRNEVTGATIKEIYGEIDKFRTDGPGQTELDDAKVYARGLFVIQNATQGGFSGTLNTMYSFGLPKDYPETFQKTVSGLSTEAVKTAAQMLLGSSDSVVVIVGDYTKVKDQLTGFANISFVDLTGKPIAAPQ